MGRSDDRIASLRTNETRRAPRLFSASPSTESGGALRRHRRAPGHRRRDLALSLIAGVVKPAQNSVSPAPKIARNDFWQTPFQTNEPRNPEPEKAAAPGARQSRRSAA